MLGRLLDALGNLACFGILLLVSAFIAIGVVVTFNVLMCGLLGRAC